MTRNSTERGAWWQVRSRVERIHFVSLHTKSAAENNASLPEHLQMWNYPGFQGVGVFARF